MEITKEDAAFTIDFDILFREIGVDSTKQLLQHALENMAGHQFTRDTTLDTVAQEYADLSLKNNFTDHFQGGFITPEALKKLLYEKEYNKEILGFNANIHRFLEALRNSKDHYDILMDPHQRYIGIGIAINKKEKIVDGISAVGKDAKIFIVFAKDRDIPESLNSYLKEIKAKKMGEKKK
jgi:hypothetical protein